VLEWIVAQKLLDKKGITYFEVFHSGRMGFWIFSIFKDGKKERGNKESGDRVKNEM